MALRQIITLPDPRLRMRCAPVAAVDGAVRALMDDMLETMYAAPGIGLAAIQVGEPMRLIVLDPARKDEAKAPLFLANPRVVATSDETSSYEEGCLSIPDHYEEVTRPARVRVAYLDRDGAEREIEADGLMATVLQHEIDHLDGVLFVDHISRLKRELIVKKFRKQAKREAEAAADAVD